MPAVAEFYFMHCFSLSVRTRKGYGTDSKWAKWPRGQPLAQMNWHSREGLENTTADIFRSVKQVK